LFILELRLSSYRLEKAISTSLKSLHITSENLVWMYEKPVKKASLLELLSVLK